MNIVRNLFCFNKKNNIEISLKNYIENNEVEKVRLLLKNNPNIIKNYYIDLAVRLGNKDIIRCIACQLKDRQSVEHRIQAAVLIGECDGYNQGAKYIKNFKDISHLRKKIIEKSDCHGVHFSLEDLRIMHMRASIGSYKDLPHYINNYQDLSRLMQQSRKHRSCCIGYSTLFQLKKLFNSIEKPGSVKNQTISRQDLIDHAKKLILREDLKGLENIARQYPWLLNPSEIQIHLGARYGRFKGNLAHLAASHGKSKSLQLLIEKNPLLLNAAGLHAITPLYIAMAEKNLDMIKFLVIEGADLHQPSPKDFGIIYRQKKGAKSCLDLINQELAYIPTLDLSYRATLHKVRDAIEEGMKARELSEESKEDLIHVFNQDITQVIEGFLPRQDSISIEKSAATKDGAQFWLRFLSQVMLAVLASLTIVGAIFVIGEMTTPGSGY